VTTAKKAQPAAAQDVKELDARVSDLEAQPSTEDLQAQIAELQAQLDEARAAQPAAIVAADIPPAVVEALEPPKDMPAGFVFNSLTGQQWCPQCIAPEHPLDPTASSWTCEHGSWQGAPRLFHPAT